MLSVSQQYLILWVKIVKEKESLEESLSYGWNC
jgi:hypothetical protein